MKFRWDDILAVAGIAVGLAVIAVAFEYSRADCAGVAAGLVGMAAVMFLRPRDASCAHRD